MNERMKSMKWFAVGALGALAASLALAAEESPAGDAERNQSSEMNAMPGVASERRVKDGVRVLFLGNSITLHGAAPQIGWTNEWGMAASAADRDYVHLVTRGIERKTGREDDVRVLNLADFERGFRAWNPTENLKSEIAFDPDYLIIALGENVPDLPSADDQLAYRKAFKGLLGAFLDGRRRRPNVIVRGVFWSNPTKDREMAHVASDYAVPFVRADLSGDRSMTAAGLFAHGGVASHPGDRGMAVIAERILDGLFPRESGYAAWVDGRPVEVRPNRVSAQPFNQWAPGYQRPVDQTEIAGLLRFETEGACQLRVRQTPGLGPLRPTTNVLVRPLSHGIRPEVEGNGDITFTIPKPGYYVLEIDGLHRPLEIFAQPKRDFATERREANIVFGPGRHEPVVVKLKSHDRVYIDRDAVVFGSFQADGIEDVKVSGYGIICGSRNRRVGNNCYREGMDGAVRIIDSRNVTFDGPTVVDSCCWCVAAFNSSDLALRNLKVTGAWRYNTDGIDICNSQRVRVENCYVHSFDDTLVVKGNFPERDSRDPVEDVRFSGCVCWCGWGNTLEVGFETWAKHMRGISFEDCDLIHNNNRAMSVHLGGPTVVEDVTYRNIRIECDGSDERSILQTDREQKVACQKGNRCSWLAVSNEKMFTQNGLYGATRDFSKEPHGTVRRLTVENVSIRCTNGAASPAGWASAQPGSSFGALSISNVTMDGSAVDLGEIKKAFSNATGGELLDPVGKQRIRTKVLAHSGPWRFDGTAQQRVSFSAEAVPDLGSTNRAWTVMMEIRPDRDVLDRLDAYGKMFLKLSAGGMYTALTDGQWHLIALTFDPDRMVSAKRPQGHHWYTTHVDPQCPTSACHVVSHDGTWKGRLEFLLPISTRTNRVILGGPLGYRGHTVPYKGEMRNVRVFDRLLSEEEIKARGQVPREGCE